MMQLAEHLAESQGVVAASKVVLKANSIESRVAFVKSEQFLR